MDKILKLLVIDGDPNVLDKEGVLARKAGYIFIRNGKEYDKVRVSDIIYIAGDAEYLAFHIKGYEKPLREKSSFAAITQLLTPDFVQIHRSSMINMEHVGKVGRSYVVMDDGTELRVSDSNRERFYSHIASLTVGKKGDAPA